jgi:capsule polysaccharide export protein KpsE/RkpR
MQIISRRDLFLIGAAGFLCAVVAYVGTRYMQRAYMSSISMLSAQEDNDNALQRVTNQLGAVAGLLGVGASGGRRDVNESLATLRSRLLVADFLKAEEFLDDVLEVLGPEAVADLSEEDRLQAAVTYFQDNILTVAYDTRSSLMVVSITWVDRHRAAELANDYIDFANEAMRQRGIAAARNRIQFLDEAAKNATTVELRQAIFRLVESQVNAEMLAATKPDYAFIIVDPAVPAGVNEFVRPQRALLSLLAAMFGAGLVFGVLLLLGRIRLPGSRH